MRTLKILAVVLAALALGAAATWIWIRHAADRRWAEAQERIQQLVAAHPPVLQPLPSSAASKEIQIHFVAAIREAVRRNSREGEARELVRSRKGGEAVDGVLIDAQEFLEHLHRGARRCAAAPSEFPPGWRGEWDATVLQFTMNSCVLRARQLRERKAPFEAAETLLDSLQLARFWAASGKGPNRADAVHALGGPLDELREILAHEPLSREQLRLLDRELGPLDGALRPPGEFLEPEVARWAESLTALDLKEGGLLDEAPYRWRYLLPGHLMKAEAFEFYDLHLHRLLAAQGKPYRELEACSRKMYEQLKETKNPILFSVFPFGHVQNWVVLDRMAQFRLLRVAAHYRATGRKLPLKDPFGSEILNSRTESRMRFWSIHRDGIDDGGEAQDDLVLEVDHPRPE
jgi:hypothetical protein